MYQLKIDPGVTLNSLIYSFEKRAFHVRTMGCFTFFFKALAPQKKSSQFSFKPSGKYSKTLPLVR